MTYCVGMLMDAGLAFLSDTRTNAGVDQINSFRKMSVFENPGERVLTLLSAGNLAITQAVVSLIKDSQLKEGASLLNVSDMFAAARHVGDCIRDVHRRDAVSLKAFGIDFNASFLLGGQIKGEAPRLFSIYAAGNFVEATVDTPYFQIGESKYGKPILDRIFHWDSTLEEAAKCALISMDSTLKSNLSVGMPLDLMCYRRDSLRADQRLRIEADNPYFKSLRTAWGERIKQAFRELPGLDLEQCVTK
ncbi:MAG: peptidase [Hydrogenophilales bacterium 28-61-23]|nr:MAG: peptidase [Hydrogenophilales bacterium 28-61-23]